MKSSNRIGNMFQIFIKGILAGIAIGIGGWLYIKTRETSGNLVLAAFLFSIGLILICNFGFFLYTGKICYALQKENQTQTPHFIIQLLIGLIGNYLGALLMGTLFRLVTKIPEFVDSMIETKLSYAWWQTCILAFFCGMLIYFAVEGFAKIENPLGKYVVLTFCVAGFILCGFEHCIANMFYLSIDSEITIKSVGFILLVILGNSIGGLLVPTIRRCFRQNEVRK